MTHTVTGIVQRLTLVLILASLILFTNGIGPGEAHQDPCHRMHSCPSDHGTYVCGDRGRCDQCPDNQYCQSGKPRSVTQPSTQTPKAAPPQIQTAKVVRVIDGDTVVLSTGEEVRLIGVDTPETKHPRKPVEPCAPLRLGVSSRAEGEARRMRDAMAETNLYDGLTTSDQVAAKGGPR